MLFTRRALVMLLIVTASLILSSLASALLVVAATTALVVLAAFIVDWRILPGPRELEVHRQNEPRLSLGADNHVRVTVTNRSPRAVFVQVRDESPDSFGPQPLIMTGATSTEALRPKGALISPRTDYAFNYSVHPPRRGDYAFGYTNLRWWSHLGLLIRQARFDTRAPVKVYPNLLNLKRYELLARRGHLAQIGLRPVRRLGSGSEFERLREYEADDDYRRIDWNATARRGKPITREYQIERSQNVVCIIDAGRLMRAPVGDLTKLDYAVNTALMLCYAALLRGDKVGLLSYADEVSTWLAPRAGQGQFHRMLALLYNVNAQPVESNIARAVAWLGTQQRKRALLVFFTDLAAGITADAIVQRVTPLYPRHVPLVVTVGDPSTAAITRATLRSTGDVYRRVIAEQTLDARALLLEKLRARGALTLDAPADQLTAAVVNRYLEIKARSLI